MTFIEGEHAMQAEPLAALAPILAPVRASKGVRITWPSDGSRRRQRSGVRWKQAIVVETGGGRPTVGNDVSQRASKRARTAPDASRRTTGHFPSRLVGSSRKARIAPSSR